MPVSILDQSRMKQLDSNIRLMLKEGATEQDVMKYSAEFVKLFGKKKDGGVAAPLPLPSQSPQEKARRHQQIKGMDYNQIVQQYDSAAQDALTLKTKSGLPDFVGQYEKMAKIDQSREGKVASIAKKYSGTGVISKGDLKYVADAAPIVAKQIMAPPDAKTIDPKTPINEVEIDQFLVNNKENSLLQTAKSHRENFGKALDLAESFIPDLNRDMLRDDSYAQSVADNLRKIKKQSSDDLEKKYPIKYRGTSAMAEIGGFELEPYRENEDQYKVELAELKAKHDRIEKAIVGVSAAAASLDAKLPGIDPKDVGLKYMKYANPDLYKMRSKANLQTAVDSDLMQVGVNIKYANAGDINQLANIREEENVITDRSPDKAVAETYRRLGAEIYKSGEISTSNWLLNRNPTDEELDKASQQLPDYYRSVYEKHIKGKRGFLSQIPQTGAINQLYRQFETTNFQTVNYLNRLGGQMSESDIAKNTLDRPFQTRYEGVGANPADVNRLKELNAKKDLTVDELNEKADLETFTNVRSTPSEIIDGSFGLAGQVLYQALMTRGIGGGLFQGARSLGIASMPTKAAAATGLGGAAESIASTAVSGGLTMADMYNVAGAAVAFASSYDAADMDALSLFPDDPAKRKIFATTVGSLNALTERIFKDEKVFDAFKRQVAPNVVRLVEDISANKLSQQLVSSKVKDIVKAGFEFVKLTGIENLKETTEEVATSVGTSTAKLLLAPAKFEMSEAVKDAVDTAAMMFSDGWLVAAFAGAGRYRANNVGIPALSQLGVTKGMTESVKSLINAQVLAGNMTTQEAVEKMRVVDVVSQTNAVDMDYIMRDTGIRGRAAQKYSIALANEKLLMQQMNTTQDAALKSQLQSRIKESENLRKQILNREVFIDSNYRALTPEQATREKKQMEDAIKENIRQQQEGGAGGGVVQPERAQEGQPEVGQGEGGVGQTPVAQADAGDRTVSREGRVREVRRQIANLSDQRLADIEAVNQEDIPEDQKQQRIADIEREYSGKVDPLRAEIGESQAEAQQFGSDIDRTLEQTIPLVSQSLASTAIEYQVVEDDAEMTRLVGKPAEGAFVSHLGKVYINKARLKTAIDAKIVVWHEAAHPVMNILMNTNRPLYDRVIRGMQEAAKKNVQINRAVLWAKAGYEGKSEQEQFGEAMVETVARIGAGMIDPSTLDTGFRQTIIDFVNKIAAILGIKPILKNTDLAEFKRVASDVADALKTGRDISEIVGAENVMEFSNVAYNSAANSPNPDGSVDFDTAVQLKVGEGASSPSDGGWLTRDKMVSPEEISKYSISRIVFYDNTKVGGIQLKNRLRPNLVSSAKGMGGFGYSYQEEAINTKSLLAFTNVASAIQLVNRARLYPDSAMGVAMQNPLTAHLGNITTRDILWGPSGQFQISVRNSKDIKRVVSIFSDTLDALRSSITNSSDISAIDRAKEKMKPVRTIQDLYKNVISGMSFGIRNQIHSLMLQDKPTKITKSTRESHVFLHYDLGIPTLSEISDAISEDYFKNAETGDIIKYVKPFTDKIIYTSSREIFDQYKGKELGDGYVMEFIDGMPSHESYPIIVKGENIGVGEKYFGANDVFDSVREKGVSKKQSFYPVGRMKAEAPAGQIPSGAKTYGEPVGVQMSVGNRQLIIDQAKADGTYLKAPNGQQTNLTEDQWVTVRTPEFKNWFGDWENDPANASKVVDENGEPMVVYHGSSNSFDTFMSSKAEGWGEGIYFASNVEDTKEFGEKMYEVFLNIKKPITDSNISSISEDVEKTKAWEIESKNRGSWDSDNNISYLDYRTEEEENIDLVNKAWRELGYDGIMFEGSNNISGFEIVAFNPTQIKSATENIGAFSTTDPRIQMSVGGRNLVGQINWEKSPEGKGDPSISARSPIVTKAAQDLSTGKITNDEYRATVSANSPITPITRFFEPATEDEVSRALDKNQALKANSPIDDGTMVGLRLDIPAYKNNNTWVVSVHEGDTKAGKSISYRNVARITDVRFGVEPKASLAIAAGTAKAPINRIYGKWKNIPGASMTEQAENAKKIVQDIVDDPAYVQVGMNPFRHSYFYDRNTDMGRPIVSAEEVIQVGGLVYAKNPVYGKWTDQAYSVKGLFDAAGARVQFSAGNRGLVVRSLSRVDPVKKQELKKMSEPSAVTAGDGWMFFRMPDGTYQDAMGDSYDSWEDLKKVGEDNGLELRLSTPEEIIKKRNQDKYEDGNGLEESENEIFQKEFNSKMEVWNFFNDEGLNRLGYDSPMEMPEVDRQILAALVRKGVEDFERQELSTLADAYELIGNSVDESIADAYLKAKADGSNPEFVSQVESAIGGTQASVGNRNLDRIISDSKAAGTYMKAPNGKPTNLTESQWATVRTSEFKNWFGDWEADPMNASKIVDENGEPMVVYHGTDETIDAFDTKKQKDRRWGRGFYFTTSQDEASTYGRNVIPVFLKAESMSDMTVGGPQGRRIGDGDTWAMKGRISRDAGIVYMVKSPTQIKSATENVGAFSTTDPRIQMSVSQEKSRVTDYVKGQKQKGMTQEEIEKDLMDRLGMEPIAARLFATDPDVWGGSITNESFMGGSGSRFSPRNIPVAPVPGAKRKMLKDIVFDLSKGLNQKISYGKSKRALGSYNPSLKLVRISFNNDLPTTAHEIGHSIDDEFSVMAEIEADQAAVAELNQFAVFGSKPPANHPDPAAYIRGEGFAEFMRAYLVNPDATVVAAPNIARIFNQVVPDATRENLKAFSDDIRGWAGMSGIDRIMSNVQMDPEKLPGTLAQMFKKKKSGNFSISYWDRLGTAFLDEFYIFDNAIKHLMGIRGMDTIVPKNDPEILLRLLGGFDAKFGDMMENGLIDSTFERVLDSGNVMNVSWLLDPIADYNSNGRVVAMDGEVLKDRMNAMVALMVAERTVELGFRFKRADILSGIGGGIFTDFETAEEAINQIRLRADYDKLVEAVRRYREMSDAVLRYMVDKGRLAYDEYDADGNLIGGYLFIKQNNLHYVAMNRIQETEPGQIIESKFGSPKNLGSKDEVLMAIQGSTKTIQNPYVSMFDNVYRGYREADRNEVLLNFRNLLVDPRMMGQGQPNRMSDIGYLVSGPGKDVVTVFVNGKPEYWKFHTDVANAIKGIGEASYNLPPLLTALPRMLRWTVTNFPVFAMRNIVRDTQHRIIISNEGNLFDQVRALVYSKDEHDKAARSGALNSGMYFKSKEMYYSLLKDAEQKISKAGTIVTTKEYLPKIWTKYQNFLYRSENANRIAEYKNAYDKAIKEGMDPVSATVLASSKARSLIDFAVAGRHMKWINQLVPFSNAAVQGLRSAYKRVTESPGSFVARTALFTVLPQVALWYLNHSDEDDEKEYEDLLDYQRDMFYNFKVGDVWMSIPKPFELGVIAASIDRALSYVNGREKAFDGFGGTIAKSMFMFEESDLAGPYQKIIEVQANYDFFREKNIISPYEYQLDIEERKGTTTASNLGKFISGAVSVFKETDPRMVDFFIKGQFSYFGNLAIKASNLGEIDARTKFGLNDTGFAKEFSAYSSKSLQDLFKFAKGKGVANSKPFKTFNDKVEFYFTIEDKAERARYGRDLIDEAPRVKQELEQYIKDKKDKEAKEAALGLDEPAILEFRKFAKDNKLTGTKIYKSFNAEVDKAMDITDPMALEQSKRELVDLSKSLTESLKQWMQENR